MQNTAIQKACAELGLGALETKVYLEALKPGNITIAGLAHKLRVERATVYAALERLKKFGLVTENKKPYTRGIGVEPPNKILLKLKKKISNTVSLSEDFEKSLPDLMSTFHARGTYQKVRFYEDKENFLSVFDQILTESNDDALFFGDAHSFINFIGVEFEKIGSKEESQKIFRCASWFFTRTCLLILKKSTRKICGRQNFCQRGMHSNRHSRCTVTKPYSGTLSSRV